MLMNFSSVFCFPEIYLSYDEVDIIRESKRIDETNNQILDYGRRIINATLSEP